MTRTIGIVTWAALATVGASLDLVATDDASIKQAAAEIAKGLYEYHNPDSTAGQFDQPEPWFWWLSGSGWTGLLDYTVYTGDTTYKADILSSLAINVGPKFDFMPPDQSGWEANDDQAYWLYAALTAMEYDFEPLECVGTGEGGCANSWLQISINAFNLYTQRWAEAAGTCGGGLKWQLTTKSDGYYYKNSVTNGGFFQTAARLARHTGNQTYADWAVKIWDWSRDVELVGPEYHVFDGTGDRDAANCTEVNHDEWSYNIATYMHGAAHMYAATGDAAWEEHAGRLVGTAASAFFGAQDGIMYEQKCEPGSACTTDQTSFKASLARWMGKTAVLVPGVRDQIMALLSTSAQGAASACSGKGGSTCGQKWTTGSFDGQTDFGTELSALETVQSLLALTAPELSKAKA